MESVVQLPLPAPTRRLPSSWIAVGASGLLHLALFWQYTTAPVPTSPAPLGHWVEMIQGASPTLAARTPTPSKKSVSPLDTPSHEPAPASESAPTAPALGNTDQATGLSGPLGDLNGTQVSVRDRYLYELVAFINQFKRYPPRARYLNQTGLVEVAFHVHADGSITDPHIVRPCIHDLLNNSAVELVARVGRFRPLPSELGLSVFHVTVPIQYELN